MPHKKHDSLVDRIRKEQREGRAAAARRVQRGRPIFFDKGIPSNFYVGAAIWVVNPYTGALEMVPTNEHYFNAYKEFHATFGSQKGYNTIIGAAYGSGNPNPGLAKRLGRQVNFTNQDRLRWDMFVAPEIMFRANLAKFIQNNHCQVWLRETGSRTLVEHRPDPIWGDNMDGSGKNLLGKILMLVRAHIVGGWKS